MTLAPERRTTNDWTEGHLKVTRPERRRNIHEKSGRPDPSAHLTAEDVEALGLELDALRQEVMDSRGERDAAYIHRIIAVQRGLEMGCRAALLFSKNKFVWVAATGGLAIAKIIENMELGHNIMHGQWDWMRDPKIHSSAWEWDNVSPASQWKHAHNEEHHTYTNVLGKDNDLGFGIMRVDEDQRWKPFYLGQPVWHVINACMFEYSIAAYDLELGAYMAKKGRHTDDEKADFKRRYTEVLHKIRQQVVKDYLVQPAITGSAWKSTLAATFTANLIRNLWTNTVIICGHFPEGVETFEKETIDGETRGEWYLRQMLGSANIVGSPFMHLMTGNLSHQVEHHLFPDMPSNRLGEIAPRIRDIFDRYELTYVTGSLAQQAGSAYKKVVKLALPNPEPGLSQWQVLKRELKKSRERAKRRKARQAKLKERLAAASA